MSWTAGLVKKNEVAGQKKTKANVKALLRGNRHSHGRDQLPYQGPAELGQKLFTALKQTNKCELGQVPAD